MPSLKTKLREIASRLSEEPESTPIAVTVEIHKAEPMEEDPDPCLESISCSTCGRTVLQELQGVWIEFFSCPCGELGGFMLVTDYSRYMAVQRRRRHHADKSRTI